MSHNSVSGRSAIVWLVILSLLTANAVAAVAGKVVGVHDGDSLTLLVGGKTEVKVRLEGIDAPELKQDFGTASKKALSDMVYGKEIRLVETGKDRYKRTLANVYVGDAWVNLAMIERGMAWFFVKYSKNELLKRGEAEARKSKRGLWKEGNPTPPWIWRAKK